MYIAHLACLKHLFKNILLKAILWILYKIEIDHCWWQFTFIHVVYDDIDTYQSRSVSVINNSSWSLNPHVYYFILVIV